ncbi:MAG TPA: AAA family ATPase [Oligoflexia bacterium]|nr:AAA family ATPase [Oligoflexia bacterium]HMP49603.1 AAA family ATPase [Oligoflexia bacterium]
MNSSFSEKLIERLFALAWYSVLLFLGHFLILRFGGDSWVNLYPLSSFAVVVLVTQIALSLTEAEGIHLKLRIGIPLAAFFGIWYTGNFTTGIVQAFQEVLGPVQFLVLLLSIVVSLAITIDGEGKERSGSDKDAPKRQRAFSMKKPMTASLRAFEQIHGQDHVIEPVKEIARLTRANIRVGKARAPFSVMLFIGPTGVGKTETARALSIAAFGSEDALIRFDMGQFSDPHQANRFYGPPPGYVGSDQGGQLTRAVLRKPRSVVLLDEVEKADSKIWDAFLPVFDEGYIVDGSTNTKVDMTQTIIVLTSNLLSDVANLERKSPQEIKEAVLATGAFRNELIGRINDIFIFKPLSSDTIREILTQRVDNALWNLAERGIKVHLEPDEIEEMVSEVHAAKFGVRQIDDVVRAKLRSRLTEKRSHMMD